LPGPITVQNPEPFAHQQRKDGLRNKIVNSFFAVRRSAFTGRFAARSASFCAFGALSMPKILKSMSEIRAQLIYALDFGYLKPEVFSELDQLGRTATKCVVYRLAYNGRVLATENSNNEMIYPTSRNRLKQRHGTPNAIER